MAPHATSTYDRRSSSAARRSSSAARLASSNARRPSSTATMSPSIVKFPDFAPEFEEEDDDDLLPLDHQSPEANGKIHTNGAPIGSHAKNQRVPFKRQDTAHALRNNNMPVVRPARQKSLNEALQNVRRNRNASIGEQAHEIAESLKAPVSLRLVTLCLIWFGQSILSNASSKAILTALPKPVTLTIMQFFQVASWCFFSAWLAKRSPTVRNMLPVLKNGIRRPNKEIIMTTLPLTAFQIGGHILNSDAMSRIPVALVHTIKGLAPLMTVFAYRTFFEYEYSRATYLSLIPLTLGVVMACSASFAGNIFGLILAFGSTVLFVTQNIVSKKIFTDAQKAEVDGVPIGRRKPDKLNLLCYSSAMACLFTFPIWLWSEGLPMLAEYMDEGAIGLRERPGSLDHGALALEFMFNGTFHFGQSLVAFVLLGLVSPVTYSVASLIKRVAVIIFAIVWFGNPMTAIQAMGFILTFLGLYLYDRTSDADKVDRREREKEDASKPLLPINTVDAKKKELHIYTETPINEDIGRPFVGGGGYTNGEALGSGPGRPRKGSNPMPVVANGVPIPLPPDAKIEKRRSQNDMVGTPSLGVR